MPRNSPCPGYQVECCFQRLAPFWWQVPTVGPASRAGPDRRNEFCKRTPFVRRTHSEPLPLRSGPALLAGPTAQSFAFHAHPVNRAWEARSDRLRASPGGLPEEATSVWLSKLSKNITSGGLPRFPVPLAPENKSTSRHARGDAIRTCGPPSTAKPPSHRTGRLERQFSRYVYACQ